MADRGKLLSIATRLEIKERRVSEPVRKVAASLGLSKTTVSKYSREKNGTKPLKDLEDMR